jgi:cytochrome c biogenesis protein CcmG, thiol:disulfide interchange protein DsbE
VPVRTAQMTAPTSDPARPRRHPLRFGIRAAGLVTAGLLIALLVYGVVAKNPDTTIDDRLAHANAVPAPVFDLAVLQRGLLGHQLDGRIAPALGDGRVTLRELRGTPVVLNFWASWCVPCREEAPELERTWRERARPAGVLFVGLNMQDVTEDARDFMREFRIDYLNLRDPTNAVARRYSVTGVPETFFLSAGRQIVGHVIGVASPSQLRDGIAAARAGRPQAARRGGAQGVTR